MTSNTQYAKIVASKRQRRKPTAKAKGEKNMKYYFIKVYCGKNVNGQELWEHCYPDTLEEAKEIEARAKSEGRKTTPIEECVSDAI